MLELWSLAHPQYFLINLGCGGRAGEEEKRTGQKPSRILNDSVIGKCQVNAGLSSNQES